MSSKFRIRRIDTDTEKSILIGLIISTEFCRDIQSILDYEYFQISYGAKIARWCLDYFEKYREAPNRTIQSIFETEKQYLEEVESVLIEQFLQSLSNKYIEDGDEKKFNSAYLLDKSLEYFKERAILNTATKTQLLIDAGKTDEAEKTIQNYKQVAKVISNWVDPFENNYVGKTFDVKTIDEDNEDALLSFTGDLGRLVGPLERGWLVGFLAPMKRGKSFFLQETALQAAMFRLNVVMVSLEMGDKGLANRMYHRLTALGATKDGYVYPCFDCQRNQDGTCTKVERTNRITLITNDNKGKPDFGNALNYKPCTVCRGAKGFKVASWYEVIKRDAISLHKVVKHIKGFTEMHGHGLRIKAYPAYSANLSNVKKDLDVLEYADGFVPDVIVIDYADILAPESKYSEGREKIDETWKALKNLAATRHCLVVTASQSTRATLNTKNVRASDVAEDIRKVAHVDAMFALNQTVVEKKEGVIRVGCATHRWQEFDENKFVYVLQQLSLGQVVLDSCF